LSLKKLRARISGQNSKGMYVVSLGDFDQKLKAVKKLEEIKEHYPQSWIRETW
jgi:hypothetical protein